MNVVITVAKVMYLRDFGHHGLFMAVCVYCSYFLVILDGQFTSV